MISGSEMYLGSFHSKLTSMVSANIMLTVSIRSILRMLTRCCTVTGLCCPLATSPIVVGGFLR